MGGKVLDHEAKDILRQGYNDGYNNGKKYAIIEFIKEGIITLADGAARLGMSETELAKYV